MTIRKARALLGAGVLIAGTLAVLSSPQASATPSSIRSDFTVPVTASVTWDGWCDNKGPNITVDTSALFGDTAVQVSFWNSPKGQKQLDLVGTATLLSSTGSNVITVQKAPTNLRIGATGNPFIYYNGPEPAVDGVDPDIEYIGRCVQDGKIGQHFHGRWSSDFDVNAFTNLTLQAVSCTNKGSSVKVDTETTTDDVSASLVFSNSDLGLNPQHIVSADVAATWEFLLADGLTTRKGWGAGGAGGNPIIHTTNGSLALANDLNSFVANGPEVDHGRCNKLT